MSGDIETRFWAKVLKSNFINGCWIWKAAKDGKGYGLIGQRGGRLIKAHRFSYQLHKGPIPRGLQLDHLCMVRNCVNPDHLEPVSCRENILRGNGAAKQNANKTHCKSGHKLSGKNLAIRKDGYRNCRACNARRTVEFRARSISRR